MFLLPFLASSCNISPPPAPKGSNLPPRYIFKFVPEGHDGTLKAFFCLADVHTNQVAANGRLRIQVYTETSLTIGDATPTADGMKVKSSLYDNTFSIGATNFHWDTFGSMITVQDLAFHFVVPYENFKKPVRRGRVATVAIEFHPDGQTNVLVSSKNASLY